MNETETFIITTAIKESEQFIRKNPNSNKMTFKKILMNLNNNIDWELIFDKMIGKNDEYCLKLIKSKSWTNKSSYENNCMDEMLLEFKYNIFKVFYYIVANFSNYLQTVNYVKLDIKNNTINQFTQTLFEKTFLYINQLCTYNNISLKTIDLSEIVSDKELLQTTVPFELITCDNNNKLLLKDSLDKNIFEEIWQFNMKTVELQASHLVYNYLLYDEIKISKIYNVFGK